MHHDEYYKTVLKRANERLDELFANCGTKVEDITGDENGIDSFCDAKAILAFVFHHYPTDEEKACAILSVGEALHAWHEVHEHDGEANYAQKSSTLVK